MAAALTAVALVYAWFATGGTGHFGVGGPEPTAGAYYDLLGEAFLAGQLHLKVTPRPELLALPNPYDPSRNDGLRLHDATLYRGRYYLYWGPVPGLIHALWRLVTNSPLYDSIVGVGAALVMSGSFWLILRRVRQRYFPRGASWVVWGSSLTFAAGGIMLYLVGRPAVYHEALLMAAAFLVPAWYSLLLAWEPGAGRRRYLLLSGVLLGCAIGSRVTYLVYAVGPGLVLAWGLLRAGLGARRAALLDLVAFGAPLAVTGLLLVLYNVLRFGSPIEFGVSYVLQGSTSYYAMTRQPDGSMGSFFSPAVIGQNLMIYLFGLPDIHLVYPYFPVAWVTRYTGSGFTFPDVSQYRDILVEPPVISLFLLSPTSLLALLLPMVFVPRRGFGLGGLRPWATGIALGALFMLLLLSASRGVTVRYTVDVLPAITLLGAVALLAGSAGRGVGTWAPTQSLLVLVATVGWGMSLLFGLLLGFGVWLHSFPIQAAQVQSVSNEWVARLGATLRPGSVQTWTEPTGRTTWRGLDGRYLKDGTIYLRVPEPGTTLVLRFASQLPAGTELAIVVDGETRMRGSMAASQQVWWTPPLADLETGEIVPIRLQVFGQATFPPGSHLPLVISSLHFTRGPDEAALYRRLVR
ncbi:MAG: hypothetical protein H0V51_23230 [Chloroflexi bacterium]|nr:hypothetical protein [Chloroflexota bacterium]